jgi:fructose-1,6-bisphosphatase/sedoheptulose 1,7-bisphosphatase-like protein
MPCLTQKISVGASITGLGLTAIVAVGGTPTVAISAAAIAAMGIQFVGYCVAVMSLAACMDDHDRHQDAETLRREIDELKREMQKLQPSLVP